MNVQDYSSILFNLVLPISIVTAIIYLVKTGKLNSSSIYEIFNKGAIPFIGIIQTISTTGEVVILISVATSNGRMSIIDALFRFGILGIFEVFTTHFFISSIESELKEAMEDGYITILEFIRILLTSGLYFVAGFLVTSALFIAYLESINLMEVQLFMGDDTPGILAIFALDLEFNPEYFMAVKDEPGRIEWAAVVTVYATPALSLILVMLLYNKYKKEGIQKYGKRTLIESLLLNVKAIKNIGRSKPTTKSTSKTSLPATPRSFAFKFKELPSIKNISTVPSSTKTEMNSLRNVSLLLTNELGIPNLKDIVHKMINYDYDRLIELSNSNLTHDDLNDDGSNKLEVLNKISNEFISMTKELNSSTLKIRKHMSDYKKLYEKRTQLLTRTSTTTVSTIELNSTNVALKALVDDINKAFTKYKVEYNKVKQFLISLGITVPTAPCDGSLMKELSSSINIV